MAFDIEAWGARYGLTRGTVDVLIAEEVVSPESLVSLNDCDIRDLNIPIGQRALLRKGINDIKGEGNGSSTKPNGLTVKPNDTNIKPSDMGIKPNGMNMKPKYVQSDIQIHIGSEPILNNYPDDGDYMPTRGKLKHSESVDSPVFPRDIWLAPPINYEALKPANWMDAQAFRERQESPEQEESDDDDDEPALIGKVKKVNSRRRKKLSDKKDSLTEEEKADVLQMQPFLNDMIDEELVANVIVIDTTAIDSQVTQFVEVKGPQTPKIDEEGPGHKLRGPEEIDRWKKCPFENEEEPIYAGISNCYTVTAAPVPDVKLPPPQKLPPDLPPWQPGQGAGHQWDNLPSAPPPDDPNALPPSCPPPPMQGFPAFSGYENTGGFGQLTPLVPPPPPPPPTGQAPKMEFDDVTNLKEQECREALLAFVGEHCCYGKGCAEDMNILKIQPSTALHYILETYTEGRSTGFVHEPYRGGPLDGPEFGIPPAPWAIPVQPDMLFKEQEKKVEVPHTASVKVCHACHGKGFNRCHRCHGCGWVRCMTCNGDGKVTKHDAEHGQIQVQCHQCGADGKRKCMTCGGDGAVKCNECYGYRNLKCFIQLTAKYTNHKEDHIMEKTDMPDELVRNVQGEQIFQQTLLQVWPITCYPVQEINDNSIRLVERHRTAFPSDRYIQQRHTLRAVPVTEVHYEWKDKKKRFWIYGRERKVHAPDYPQTCCWGCVIL